VLVVEEVAAVAFTHNFVKDWVVREAVEVAVTSTEGAAAEASLTLRLPEGSSVSA
jgi:hypothetical protein